MTQKVYGMTDVIHEIKRMADAMEEVLRLVKQDQEDAKKRMLAAADEGLKEHQETND